MEKSEENGRPGVKRAGAVWAALALSAGLAAAPAAALAEEAGGTADAGAGDAAQGGQAQAQPQAGGQQGDAGDAGQQAAGGSAQATSQAPAASSDRGTYEKAGLHRVTVTYVDEKGSQIAPAHREALADDESYGVKSPTVGGYELADASQATVSGTVSKGSGDVSVVVRYRSTLVTYTVVHERQVGPRSSEYRVSESETLTAPAGTKVTAAPKQYDNYTCATGAGDRTAEVTPDGRTTIVIRYDVVVPTYGVYFSTKGSYVAPQTGRAGDAVTTPAVPTRAGYSFAGWDTNGDGKADALPTTIPDHDVTATAVWRPETATYLVKYWGEDQGRDGSYHLLRTDALTGNTDSVTPAAARLDTAKGGEYQWYTYKGEDPDVAVSGDGTTVLNVYYGWKRVKVYFKAQLDNTGDDYMKNPDVNPAFLLKVFGSYSVSNGADALSVYKANGGKLNNFDYWLSVQGDYIVNESYWVAPNEILWNGDNDLEVRLLAKFTNTQATVNYSMNLFQNSDGKSYSAKGLKRWRDAVAKISYTVTYVRPGFRLTGWRTSTNLWDGNDRSTISWDKWHPVSAEDVSDKGDITTDYLYLSKANVFEFKYDRIPYDVTYYSGGQVVDKRTQLFGSTIDVSTPAGLTAPESMVFGGWYANPDFSGDTVTSLTMPEGGTHLYARWKRPDVHVTFDSAGGTPVATQTVEWGHKATEPAKPTRAGYEFGGWYYFGGTGAAAKPRLLRVVAASGTPVLFPFDLELEVDAHLVAAWRSTNTPTTYTVRHVLADGTVLCEETLPGTVGQTVSALALPRGDARRRGHAYASASGATIDLAEDASRNVVTFTYSDDATHPYVVHLWDEATGLPVAADVDFDSVEALMDYLAPRVAGYHVLFGGRGYLSDREGGQELAFWYERDPEPARPAEAATSAQPATRAATLRVASAPAAKAAPRHMAKSVPATGDPASPTLPAGIAFLGAAMAAAGVRLSRREER